MTVGSALEAPAVVSGLDDVAVVGQPIEQRGRHLGVPEDARPFTEGQVGGDDDRSTLVEPVSPRIVSALLDGTAPADLPLSKLARALPYSWAEQERRVGTSPPFLI